MKNKMIIESSTPPSNTNTLWLDMSDKNKSLKVFNNGKWEEINNTTSRLSDVVNTSEKAINQALMDSLSYGIRWKSGDVTSVVRVGNDTIRRDNPIEIIDVLSRGYGYKGEVLQRDLPLLYNEDGDITYEPCYLNETEAQNDIYLQGLLYKTVQLLTKEGQLYVKDYVDDPTIEPSLLIVDPITEGTKEQNSVYEINIMNSSYSLSTVKIDTDGKPMAKVDYSEDKILPDGVYPCYVEMMSVRPTSIKNNFFNHLIVCPQFYIKSFEDNGYKEIRVSRYKIDDTWTEQRKCAIAPTIFPYDNNKGEVILSPEIQNIDKLNYQFITDQSVSHFLNEIIDFVADGSGYMNYCEFSRIFLSLQFINAAEISADVISWAFIMGNQATLSGIYVSSGRVKVVEKDGTSKFIPPIGSEAAQYDGSKTQFFKDFFLADNGILVPMSGEETLNHYVGTIKNDGYADIDQDMDNENTTFTISVANDELTFLFSNLDYPIQYPSGSNIMKDSLGIGLIRIYYHR